MTEIEDASAQMLNDAATVFALIVSKGWTHFATCFTGALRAVQSRQAVKQYFQNQHFVQKIAQSRQVSPCISLLVNGKEFKMELNAFRLGSDKWNQKMDGTNEAATLYRDRQELIDALEKGNGKWVAGLHVIGYQTVIGATISAVVNINMLFNGEVLAYLGTVGTGTAFSLGTSTATELLRATPASEFAGPIVTAGMITLFNTYRVVNTGDWARFGKDMLSSSVASGVGLTTAYAVSGALASTGVGSPIAAVITIGATMFAGSGSKWLMSKNPLIGNPTNMEIEQQERIINQERAKIDNELAQKGITLDATVSAEKFAAQLRKGDLSIKGHDWKALASSSSTANLVNKSYRECIRWMFAMAKLRSPTGDIATGLKLLIADMS